MQADQVRIVLTKRVRAGWLRADGSDEFLEPLTSYVLAADTVRQLRAKGGTGIFEVPPRPEPSPAHQDWPVAGASAARAALEDPELRAEVEDWRQICAAFPKAWRKDRTREEGFSRHSAVARDSWLGDTTHWLGVREGRNPDSEEYQALLAKKHAAEIALHEQVEAAWARCRVKAREASPTTPLVELPAEYLPRMRVRGAELRFGRRAKEIIYYDVRVWPDRAETGSALDRMARSGRTTADALVEREVEMLTADPAEYFAEHGRKAKFIQRIAPTSGYSQDAIRKALKLLLDTKGTKAD